MKKLLAIAITAAMMLSLVVSATVEPAEPSEYANVGDALAILRHLVALESNAEVETHDFNGNDVLDVGDALLVLRGLVGLDEKRVLGERDGHESNFDPEPLPYCDICGECEVCDKICPELLSVMQSGEKLQKLFQQYGYSSTDERIPVFFLLVYSDAEYKTVTRNDPSFTEFPPGTYVSSDNENWISVSQFNKDFFLSLDISSEHFNAFSIGSFVQARLTVDEIHMIFIQQNWEVTANINHQYMWALGTPFVRWR
jgi:hypothetical protein